MATVKKIKKYQNSGQPLTLNRVGKFKKQTFETDTTGYAAGKKSFPTKVTTTRISKSGEETPVKNSPRMMNVRRDAVEEQLGQKNKMKKQMEEKAKGKMKMGGKIKKAQSGYSSTAKTVDSLRAAGAKQLGTPEGKKTLGKLKSAEAKERKEDAMKMKSTKMKMGGMMSKMKSKMSKKK